MAAVAHILERNFLRHHYAFDFYCWLLSISDWLWHPWGQGYVEKAETERDHTADEVVPAPGSNKGGMV